MTGFDSKRAMAADKLQEPVADKLERLLWEYIDLQAAHPEHKPNPKTWSHLMVYALLPAQEPVALVIDGVLVKSALPEKYTGHLYTAPPQRPWVGLTEKDFSAINQSCLTKLQAATSAESILKERNS